MGVRAGPAGSPGTGPAAPTSLAVSTTSDHPQPTGSSEDQVPVASGRLPKSSKQAKPGAPETCNLLPPLQPPHTLIRINSDRGDMLLLFPANSHPAR